MTHHAEMMDGLISKLGEGELTRAVLGICGQNVVILDADHCITHCGARFAELLDYSIDELQGRYLYELIPPGFPEIDVVQVAGEGHAFENVLPYVFRRRDGSLVHTACLNRRVLSANGQTVCSLFTLPHAQLGSEAGPDHHVVLEEYNHRVRNNLAIICALLDMEILHAPEQERSRLQISLARIRSLAMVHNQAQDDKGRLELGKLVRDVADCIGSLYRKGHAQITVEVPAAIYLNARRAVNLALALTELFVPLFSCLAHNPGTSFAVVITQRENDAFLSIQAATCCSCAGCEVKPQSRDILTGFIERSLRGKIESLDTSPLSVSLRFPVADAVPPGSA